MCNLPVLKSLSSPGHSFWNVKTASLKDLPHECDIHLPVSFRHRLNIEYSNVAFRLT
ncbi:uncharacterized protein [Blastocystis hominis]|uniref:Uncharacterized protein n=1 Tax=Blastocystis hominis TaxID=12968 RepID=D8M183_BLAHO|nr:uncharacterized protein [Blastocystis hominis]CBK21822.2 unnamed protein product [Blastocystis hominis]|eukprot:XP_012895870.1 uncharacterized protein [Blastocystis hominis]